MWSWDSIRVIAHKQPGADTLRLRSHHSNHERQNTHAHTSGRDFFVSSGWWDITVWAKCLFSGSNHHVCLYDYGIVAITQLFCLCFWVRAEEISTRARLLHSAPFAQINPASPSVPDSRLHLCQLSAMQLRLRFTHHWLLWLLSDARRSAPCFHNSSGTDGWHSCSVSPQGLLKKAINQSRHSIQAGNWPIRVAQDAYVQADDFTNWLSIYTNTCIPEVGGKKRLTGCCRAFMFLSLDNTHTQVFVLDLLRSWTDIQ